MHIEFVPVPVPTTRWSVLKDGKHVGELDTRTAVELARLAEQSGDSVAWRVLAAKAA